MRASTLHLLGGAFTLLLCLAVPALGQDEPLQAFRDGDALTLVPTDGGARIELPGGRALSVALPERAEVSALAAIDGGWVAAGSVPDATGGRKLFLLKGNDSAARPMAEPPGQEGKQRRGPMLLVDGGRLAGMAWLEGDGDRALSVRAAVWNGKRWQTPERVSFPGTGSQLALTGAVLSDGSWLLAWSAFDGQDDEIVWARRQGDAWQPVQRLTHNSVPDITPALTATADGGALIAWSQFDGKGYQMRMARFGREGWSGEHPAGASGSLYPTFLGPSRLLYLDAAAPRSWSVLDLDAQGRVKARASVASTLERPAVAFEGTQVRMRWPAAKRQVTAPLAPLETAVP
ncbi:MAG TPA: hypothetical protein VGM86_24620 [Thermoanaerobaculia bacterium]